MKASDDKRRSLLLGMAGLAVSQALPQQSAKAQAVHKGYLLASGEGEHLVHFRDGGNISIKIGAATGSENLAMGTQQVKVGTGIPIHRHFLMDEAFLVLEGSGDFILDEVRHPFTKGASIFIPKNSWHGFANPDYDLLLLWIVTPAGLDGMFRELCTPPGTPKKELSRQQINEIARKYSTEFR